MSTHTNPTALRGVGAALVTPFDAQGQVDFPALERLLVHTASHLNYWVVNGTTGESPTSSPEEKAQVLAFVKAHNPSGLPIVFGVGSNNTAKALKALEDHDLNGVSAILSATPSYNKPTQKGLMAHYTALADASPAPLLLYNVPARTGCNMLAETTLELAQHPNIIGIKEASGDLVQCQHIAKHKPADFLLISGDDLMTLALMAHGGAGVISVGANAFPQTFRELCDAAAAGDFATGATRMLALLEVEQALFAEGNPAGIKLALESLGVCERHVRLPLVAGSEALKQQIMEAAAALPEAQAVAQA